MEKKFWLEKWNKGEIGFHQNDVNPFLIKYFSSQPASTIFVPLCGKSYDLIWLHRQGHHVIGLELSELACNAFFDENKIKFNTSIQGPFKVYSSPKLTLLCGDVFDLDFEKLGPIDKIYDRAALIALPKDFRQRYSQKLKDLILFQKKIVEMLIITIDYPQEKIDGPPFSVSPQEVEILFGDTFKIQTLHRKIHEGMSLNNPRFKDIETWENVFLVTNKL